jgi:diketogulonate reductase-like aldo/keto reductase
MRNTAPRFQKEAFEANMRMVDRVRELADKKGCTPGQLALAWVHAQGPDVFPIPGTKRIKYLEVSSHDHSFKHLLYSRKYKFLQKLFSEQATSMGEKIWLQRVTIWYPWQENATAFFIELSAEDKKYLEDTFGKDKVQ